MLHVDGTCEPGTDVTFAAVAAPRRWVLEMGKMTTENVHSIAKLMECVVDHWGTPLAVMRDMSPNIGGDLARVPACFSEHWSLARTVRHERQQPKRDHPLPTSKKAIRRPKIFDDLKELLGTMIGLTAAKPAA